MCVGKKLPITPSCSAADYSPASSTQPRRQTGNTVSTVAIPPPPSRHHHNHRSRRRSRRARSLRVRRRNIAPSSDEEQRGGAIGRDGWAGKGLDERKGSDEAADLKEGAPPPWWRTENRKRGYNRYAALSSTEEDADFESQEYGSAGYGVGIIEVGGELALRRLKKRGNLDEGFGRIISLEQDSGINHNPGDARAGFSTKMLQDRRYADAEAAARSDGLKKKLPPRLTDFTFSVPSPLTTEITKKTSTRGMMTTRTTRTRTIAAAAAAAREAAAASLFDPAIISFNNRCIVGDGNKAVVLSPSSKASFTAPHSPHVLFHGDGEESAAEVKFSSSCLAWGEQEDLSRRYLLNKANKPSQTSSSSLSSASSSMAMLSSNIPAAVPSPPAQEVRLWPCISLSSPKLISILATGGPVYVTAPPPPRPCYYNSPLPFPNPKFTLPAAAACKLEFATQGQRIPVCLHTTPDSSIEDTTTVASLFSSIDRGDPARTRMDKAREKKRKGEEKGSSSALSRRKDARVVKMKKKKMMMMMMMMGRRGSWLEEELLRLWKESGDDSSPPCPSPSPSTSSPSTSSPSTSTLSTSSPSTSTTVIAPTTLIRGEQRKRPGPGMPKESRDFPTIMTGGGSGGCGCTGGWEHDDAEVVDAGWLEYILIPPPIHYYDGQGQEGGGVGKGNEKVEVPVLTSLVALAGLEDEDEEWAKMVVTGTITGNDILADGDGKKEKETEEGEGEGEGLLVDYLLSESIAGGQGGRGGSGGDDLDLLLASEMEMGESWGWDVISRLEAYD